MKKLKQKKASRRRRKLHIRKSISGTAQRPRLSVYKSNKNIYVQAIDDDKGHTITSISSIESDYKDLEKNVENAKKLGNVLGERLMEKKVDTAVFDRNGYRFHGIVKGLADGAREAGVKF